MLDILFVSPKNFSFKYNIFGILLAVFEPTRDLIFASIELICTAAITAPLVKFMTAISKLEGKR